MYKALLTLLLVFPLLTLNPTPIYAAEEAEEEAEEDAEPKLPLKYFLITPNILTFYQNTGRKMEYIVVQVQLVIRGDENRELVNTHLPLIHDALTDYFNRQKKEVIKNLSQREKLRNEAKDRVAQVLEEELGFPIIEDLLFTQYIYQ